MRRKMEAVLSFESRDKGLPKVVCQYRDRYRAISQVLADTPNILSAVHEDLARLSQGDSNGREGDYTSENIFRALLVQHLEGLPFRETVTPGLSPAGGRGEMFRPLPAACSFDASRRFCYPEDVQEPWPRRPFSRCFPLS